MSGIGQSEALGINGLGRIGKLTVWHHVARGHFERLVVNLGREVGTALEAVCGVIENDSTYGSIHRFLHGIDAAPCVRIVDREAGLLDVAGVPATSSRLRSRSTMLTQRGAATPPRKRWMLP